VKEPHAAHDAPFLTIEHAFDHKEIVLHPLSDVHIGARKHDARALKARLDKIASQGPEHRILLLGDLADTLIPASKYYEPGATLAQVELEMLVDVFKRHADRIDLIIPGNHEDRLSRLGVDISAQFASLIGKPHVYRPLPTVVRYSFAPRRERKLVSGGDAKRYDGRAEVFCHHGYGGGRLPGGHLNRVRELAHQKPDCHVFLMGHVHGQACDFDEQPLGWPVRRRRRLFVVTGTYLDSESYAIKQAYRPGAVNSPEVTLRFDCVRDDVVASAQLGTHG
jgi:hypothetical protein